MLIKSEVANNFVKIKKLDKYMIGHNGFIAGGVFKNIFNDEKFKDIDIFFKSKEDQVKAFEYFDNESYFERYYSNEKVDSFLDKTTGVIVELIKHIYGDYTEIVSKFDFTVTKFVYFKELITSSDDDFSDDVFNDDYFSDDDFNYEWGIAYDDKFFEHLHLKRLVINEDSLPLRNPLNTFNRTYRYAKYGYYPCLETKKTLVNEIKNSTRFELDDIGGELYNGLD